MNKFKKFYYRHRERIFTVLLISAPLIVLFDAMNKGWGRGTRDGASSFLFSNLIPNSKPIFILIFEALPIILIVDFAYILIKSLPHIIRYIEVKKLRKSDNTIKTEAEVAYIETKKLNPLDTQYTLKLNYNVGGNFYITDVKLINSHLVKTGIKILILCDADDPEKMTIISEAKITEDFDELFGVSGRIINIIAEGAILIFFIIILAAGV